MQKPGSGESELDWKTFGLSFGARLRYLRNLRDLTQMQLAELAGMHVNQISNLERNVGVGDRPADPYLSTVYRLARSLRVPPTALLPEHSEQVTPRSRESTDVAWAAVIIELDTAATDGDA